MALHIADGQMHTRDLRSERLAAGTVGGEHTLQSSLSSRQITSIVDDADGRIQYGTAPGYGSSGFAIFGSLAFTQFGTQTLIGGIVGTGVVGSAAGFSFKGTSIGVMGGGNPYSGVLNVLIDGVATAGRVQITVGLHTPSTLNTPSVTATDSTITTLTIPAAFPASGTIIIGNELIDYSAKGATTFTVSTRGAHGTTAAAHYTNETVYLWASTIDLGTVTDFNNKRLIWYNPFLDPGNHRIVIFGTTGATGYCGIYFDGFIIGGLIGAGNLFTQTGTVTSTVNFDGNGHADIGVLVSNNGDVSGISILGITQANTQTSNTTLLARMGVFYDQNGQAHYYLHNGPPSTSTVVLFSFAYIGETL